MSILPGAGIGRTEEWQFLEALILLLGDASSEKDSSLQRDIGRELEK